MVPDDHREPVRSYSVPGHRLSLRLGAHCSPGYFGDALWIKRRIVQPWRDNPSGFPMSVLDQADNPRRLVPHHDDSSVSSSAYPYSTLLGGIRCWVHRDRHSLPLHHIESQSRRWGACVTRASRGEELHLYDTQVIKDLFDLSPSSLTHGVISRERIAASPCERLSRPPSVESEEVGCCHPASVRSFKRLVQFSRKPLSSTAPSRSHRCTKPGTAWFSNDAPSGRSTVSSLLAVGLSQKELSTTPALTRCLPTWAYASVSTGPSPAARPFGPNRDAARDSAPPPCVLTTFLSTIPRSDSWQRLGWNFACAYIPTYLRLASG